MTKRRGPGIAILTERFVHARADSGLTMKQLGAGICSRAMVHLIERGEARPSLELMTQLALRLRRPLSYFTDDARPASERAVATLRTELFSTARRLDRLANNLDPTTAEHLTLHMIASNIRACVRIIGIRLLSEG